MSSESIERPYRSRDLTLRELRREDIYSFLSPKEGRLARVAGLPALALRLQKEFEPRTVAVVERPRRLIVGKEVYEFAIWTLDIDGRESLWMLVPTTASVPESNGRRKHRKAQQLLEAAEAAHLPLRFVLETELIEQGALMASHLRMLPSVQLARRLNNRVIVRERILELLVDGKKLRVSQIVAMLDGYLASDVRCVVCDLVHAGHIDYDRAIAWNQHSVVWAVHS